MNISPHHQRPTKYPWPGLASGVTVIIGLVLIGVIALMVLGDPSNAGGEADPTGMSRGVSSIERIWAHQVTASPFTGPIRAWNPMRVAVSTRDERPAAQ